MSNQIKMSPIELKSQAGDYGRGAEGVRDILAQLNRTHVNLEAQWKGRAFVEFDNQYQTLSRKTEEFAQLLEQIQQQLKDTAKAMMEQDVALSRNFGLQ